MGLSSQPQRSSSDVLPLVGKTLTLSFGLLLLLFQYLMSQLRVQAIEMKHVDPTDIVLVPFDLQRLTVFLAIIFCSGLVDWIFFSGGGSPPSTTIPQLLLLVYHWIQATLAFWIIAVVCGTPPTLHIYHTIAACAYLATLTVLLSDARSSTTNAVTSWWWQPRLILPNLPTKKVLQGDRMTEFYAQLVATCQIHGTLFLTVPFQVLRLYDWGSQIQRWPLPMILGSTYGFVLGSIMGSMAIFILHCSPGGAARGWYDRWTTTSTTMTTTKHQD